MEKTYSAMRAARYAVAQPAGVRNDSGENKDRSEETTKSNRPIKLWIPVRSSPEMGGI